MKLLLPRVLTDPAYRLRDIIHLGAGAQFSTTQLLAQAMAYDARRLGTDVMTLTSLAQEYFIEIQAPVQGLTLIPDAGHLAAFYQTRGIPRRAPHPGALPRRNPRHHLKPAIPPSPP
jgi:hypothetical protein